jgi:hypothetical protein
MASHLGQLHYDPLQKIFSKLAWDYVISLFMTFE